MEKTRLLIVDDEENITQILKLNLEEEGYEVHVENQGSSCVAVARQFKPDLVLLDIVMLDMEGSEVANRLRADAQTKEIPIVFLTATAKNDEVNAGGGIIGGYPFIAKPASVEQIIKVIEKHVRKESTSQ